MQELSVKYLIIGAGISGLSFARNVIEDDFLILEKETEAGGYCRTIRSNGFIWDYSGHFFHFKNSDVKKFFESKIRKEKIIQVDKCTKIYYKGSLIDYPFQKNIHQLDKDDFVDCLYWLYHREEQQIYYSFIDMLYGKFGKGIVERFLRPYNEKLYACDLNTLDTDAMGRFFPYADFGEIIDNMKNINNNSYNDCFLYPKEGAEEFVNALISDIPKDKLMYKQELKAIDTKEKVAYTQEYAIRYNCLIYTGSLKSLLEKLNLNTELLHSNKVLVLNIGFEKKSVYTKEHWIYFPEKYYNFYRVGFYDNILNQNRLSVYVEFGFKENQKIDIAAELEETLKHFKDLGIITDHKLIAYSSVIMNPAYVHISDEGQKYVSTILNKLSEDSIFTLGRYGKWKYCSIEDCIIDANSLYQSVKYNV